MSSSRKELRSGMNQAAAAAAAAREAFNHKRSRISDEFENKNSRRRVNAAAYEDPAYCASPDYSPYVHPKLSQPKLHLMSGTPPTRRRFAKRGASSLYETTTSGETAEYGITETREASRASFYLGYGDISNARLHLCGDDGRRNLKSTLSSLQKRRESGILVTGLSTDVTTEEVLAHFSPLGNLLAFTVQENPGYKKYAELIYTTCGEAEKAIIAHHCSYLFGPVTHVGYRGQNRHNFTSLERNFIRLTASYRVMVTNLPTGSRPDLLHHFRQMGQILSLSTFKGRNNRGGYYYYGFIFFAHQRDAEAAYNTMNHTLLGDRYIRVYRYRQT